MPRSNAAIQSHLEKQKLRRAQALANRLKARRQNLVNLVAEHLEKNDNDWSTLPTILKYIADTFKIHELFSQQQRDSSFQKEESVPQKKATREVLGPKKGNFHLAFFALASGFRGLPHSHSDVNCVSTVLEGPFTEALYKEEKDNSVTALAIETREKGSVSADLASPDKDKFIHSVGNFHQNKTVYSVHVYGKNRHSCFNLYYDDVTNPSFVESAAKKQIEEQEMKHSESNHIESASRSRLV
jgi:hypothetical protein